MEKEKFTLPEEITDQTSAKKAGSGYYEDAEKSSLRARLLERGRIRENLEYLASRNGTSFQEICQESLKELDEKVRLSMENLGKLIQSLQENFAREFNGDDIPGGPRYNIAAVLAETLADLYNSMALMSKGMAKKVNIEGLAIGAGGKYFSKGSKKEALPRI